ncbi:MAG: serpin family protein [Phycisphaerae bacterium]|jgi:serpin B|nr:serpin family protein [Phycisphaerae bacterium]
MKISAIALVLFFLAQAIDAPAGEQRKPPPPLTDNARTLAGGNAAFAMDLYAKLRSQEGNLFLSPHSISTALGMTYAGSRGDTASQMRDVLHFELDQGQLHPSFKNLTAHLQAREKEGELELRVANGLWGQKGLTFVKEFVQCVKEHHDAELHAVDLQHSTEKVRQTINAWVEEQTKGKIKDLFQQRVLDDVTALVLVNAIYFKGNWDRPFEKRATREAPFTLLTGKKIDVPMMQKEDEFGFLDKKTFKVVQLPYAGGDLAMVILLPNKSDGLPELEKSLTLDQVTGCLGKLSHRDVNVYLPRFRMSSMFRLDETLRQMGMKDLFSKEKADLSGLLKPAQVEGPVYIQAVVHKAFVDVNEEGTEAAAATGVAVTAEAASISMPPVIFRADHPFVFMIRDRQSDSILFMGRVVDPTEGSE